MPRRNSISGRQAKYTQKPRASYSGKVPLIRGKMVHFPGKNSENGGRINIFEGKVHRMTGKLVHFPGKNGKNDGRINVFEGKVPRIRGNLVHFPSSGRTTLLPVSHIMSTVKSVH